MALSDIITQLGTGQADFNDVADGFQLIANSWTGWTPTLSAGGSMTYTSTTITEARYFLVGKSLTMEVSISGTTGGTANTDLKFTIPSGLTLTNSGQGMGRLNDSGGAAAEFLPSTSVVVVRNMANANWGLGASRSYRGTMTFEIT